MRILHVLRSLDPKFGGPASFTLDSAREMRRLGHAVTVLSLDASDNSRSFPGVDVVALGGARGAFGYTPELVPWLRRRRGEFDVALLHGIWDYSVAGAGFALRGSTVPYLIYTHGMLDPWFEQFRLKHRKKLLYWHLILRRTLRGSAGILFTAENEKAESGCSFGPLPQPHLVVPHGIADAPGGVDSAEFLARFPQLAGKRLFLFLGRLDPMKACDVLIRGFARAAAGPDLHLVFVGPGDSYQLLLEAEVQRLGIASRVTFTGPLFGSAKWSAFRSAELFATASHNDNFCIALVEALACGLPALMTDQMDLWRDLKQEGACLVDVDTEDGVARMVTEWLALSEPARQEFRIRARLAYERRFRIAEATGRLLQVLREAGVKDTTSTDRNAWASTIR